MGYRNKNGLVLWRGRSQLTGDQIVVIATGLEHDSENRKTGAEVQTFIMPAEEHPVESLRSGLDSAVCGKCPLRGTDGSKGRGCYVEVWNSPSQVWKAWKRGSYATIKRNGWGIFTGRAVRFGAWGDPAAVPDWVWGRLRDVARGWSSYTHQYDRAAGKRAAAWSMVSVETIDQMNRAHANGDRTFRIVADVADITKAEIVCPGSKEGGQIVTCDECLLCNGRQSPTAKSIAAVAHGFGTKQALVQIGAC